MKEYFYAFLLGIITPVISSFTAVIIAPEYKYPDWDMTGFHLNILLHIIIGPAIFYGVYCPWRKITLNYGQKVWSGVWYYTAIAIFWYIVMHISHLYH